MSGLRIKERWRAFAAQLTRLWSERNAAMRAIGPAWPVAFGVLVWIGAVSTGQGREALLVTADLSTAACANEAHSWAAVQTCLRDPQAVEFGRAIFFLSFLAFCSVTMMMSAVFVMSIRRRRGYAPLLEESPGGEPRVRDDPVHPSVTLRTATAFAIGVALPLAVFLLLVEPGAERAALRPAHILPSAWELWDNGPRWLWAVVAIAAAYGATFIAEIVTHRLMEALRNWRASAQREYARARRELERRGFVAATGAVSPQDIPEAPRTNDEVARALRAAELARSGAFILYWLIARAHWLVTAPMRWVLAVLAGMGWLAATAPNPDLVPVACGAAIAGAVAALVFLYIRDKAMRGVDAEDRRHLVVDRRLQTVHRGLTLLCIIGVFAALWIGYWVPGVHRALGPATVALLGLFVVVNVLVWFVRNALAAPPTDKPPARAPRARPSPMTSGVERGLAAALAPLRWIGEQFVSVLFFIGRFAELLQGLLPAQRVLWIGLSYLLLDKIALPFLEDSSPDGADWLLTGACVAASVAGAWLLTHLLFSLRQRAPDEAPAAGAASEERGWRRFARPVLRLLAPPQERAMRLSTAVLIAPFLIAALGEDHDIARIPAPAGSERLMSASDRAEAWLAAAQSRAGEGDGVIPAIVVLAEGGGIRAASHAGQLLATLDERAAARPGGRFFEDVYVISGVSGGSVGAGAYLAARAERGTGASDGAETQRVRDLLDADLLTPLFAGLFASDFVSIFLPLDLPTRLARAAEPDAVMQGRGIDPCDPRAWANRADFFEVAMERAWRAQTRCDDENVLQRPLETVAQRAATGPAPIVLLNTFSADDGMLATASNTQFEPCPDAAARAEGTALVTLQGCLWASPDFIVSLQARERLTLPLSTAMHVSARFPLSNPPGLIDVRPGGGEKRGWRERRFVDGGYADNSGAAAASVAVEELLQTAARLGVSERLRIIVLHIFARSADSPDRSPLGRSGALNEVSAPASALLKARGRSGALPVDGLCRLIADTPEHAARWCDNVAGLRRPAGLDADADGCPGEEGEVPTLVAKRSGYTVNWIDAPLYTSSKEGCEDKFLLGWLMGRRSHDRIGDQMSRIADPVLDAIEGARTAPRAP